MQIIGHRLLEFHCHHTLFTIFHTWAQVLRRIVTAVSYISIVTAVSYISIVTQAPS